MSALDLVKRVRDRLSKPENWTQGTASRKNGEPINIADADDSCSFCLLGALMFEDGGFRNMATEHCYGARNAILDTLQCGTLIDFNDFHTHKEIIEGLDKVIAKLETEGMNG